MIRRLHIFTNIIFNYWLFTTNHGYVIEADSELPIPGATIILKKNPLVQILILMENLNSIMFQMVT